MVDGGDGDGGFWMMVMVDYTDDGVVMMDYIDDGVDGVVTFE